ncbi:hypothetical protein BT63DRAFT_479898 [Microthyrium microscopicum]|uniref:Nucleoporin NSP1 n=1 Tax=Microthyrium microscopicum TaxID=703497 RepID=A0A6A6U947_9PEZI|nr:hypothetical protein BT63DRAFT_479898 [Microthyrium microscopicum]
MSAFNFGAAGGSAGKGLFGSTPAAANTPPASSTENKSLFGAAPATSAGTLFGSTPTSSGPAKSTLFGNTANTPAPSAGGLFAFNKPDASSAPAANPFGAASSTGEAPKSIFGAVGSNASAFATKATPSDGNKPVSLFNTGSTTPAAPKFQAPSSTTPAAPPPTLGGGPKPLFGAVPSNPGSANAFSFNKAAATPAPSKQALTPTSTAATPSQTPATQQTKTLSFQAPAATTQSGLSFQAQTTAIAPASAPSNSAPAPSLSNLFNRPTSSAATPAAPGTTTAPAATTATTSAPAQKSLFNQAPASSTGAAPSLFAAKPAASPATSAAPAPTSNLFGAKPAAPAATNTAATSAPAVSAPAATTPVVNPAPAPAASTAFPPLAGLGPLPGQNTASRLKNKSMDEILTRWATDLTKYQKEFQKQAEQVAEWDRVLVTNADKISKLVAKTFQAERDAGEVERQLTSVENHQEELEQWLDKYEKDADDLIMKAGLSGDSTGTDVERERTFKLAEKLTDRLDGLNKDLVDVIEEINAVSSLLNNTKGTDDPLSNVVRVLNSHLMQLQKIDMDASLLQAKVKEAQKAQKAMDGGDWRSGTDPTDEFMRSFRRTR